MARERSARAAQPPMPGWRSVRRRAGAPARRRRDERGSQLVEFALVFPLLVLILLAIVDFGTLFGGYVTLRSGVAAAARSASLGEYAYAGAKTCTGGPNSATAQMVCSVLADVGALTATASSSQQVGICFLAPGASDSACGGESSAGTSIANDVVVCASATAKSVTGVTTPFINGRQISAMSRLVLEQPQPSGTATSFDAFTSGSPPVVFGGTTIAGMNC